MARSAGAERTKSREGNAMKIRILESWNRRVARRHQRPFLESAMAAAALVSMADDDVRLSEHFALDEALDRIRTFEAFDSREAIDLHREIVDRIKNDGEQGRARALQMLSGFDGNEDDRLTVLYLAVVIARADHVLSAAEESALGEICERLGLSSEESLERIWGVLEIETTRA